MKYNTSDKMGRFLNDRLSTNETHYNSKLLDHRGMSIVNSRSRIHLYHCYSIYGTFADVEFLTFFENVRSLSNLCVGINITTNNIIF